MGGHLAGDVAADLAIGLLDGTLDPGGVPDGPALVAAIERANAAIRVEAVARPDQRGMGTTCTALVVGDTVTIAHVGDSRAYRSRGGRLEQLTEDHSLVGRACPRGSPGPGRGAPGSSPSRHHPGAGRRGWHPGRRRHGRSAAGRPLPALLRRDPRPARRRDHRARPRRNVRTRRGRGRARRPGRCRGWRGQRDGGRHRCRPGRPGRPCGDPGRVGCAGRRMSRAARGGAWRAGLPRRSSSWRSSVRRRSGWPRAGSVRERRSRRSRLRRWHRHRLPCRRSQRPRLRRRSQRHPSPSPSPAGPAAVRVGLDPDGVVRGAGAVLTAARRRGSASGAEPAPSNASIAATCSADSGTGLSVS